MKSRNLLALLLLVMLLLTGCGAKKEIAPLPVPAGAKAGDLVEMQDCEFQAKGEKFAAKCGTLVVQENWEKADSRLIALPVVRIPASGPNPAEPVFWLVGGPGGPNLVWSPPDWLLKKHDVVMVGYRGVEGTVTLSCPEVNRLLKAHMGKDLFSDQARNQYAAAVKRCGADYQQAGVDLSGYTVPGVIEDMEAARKAMGYERIDLFSESYGTRVAQIYAEVHPDSLYRLVLIGVNTPGHFIWERATFDEMISHISKLCAQDASCSSRTNDFAQTMYNVNHNMPERWLFFHVDPDTVRLTTQFMYMSKSSMPMIFDAYLAAANGDPSGLAMMSLMMSPMLPNDVPVYGDEFNKAGTVDRETYHGINSVDLGNSTMGAPLSELAWPLAEAWPLELISKDLREFQDSNAEMLLINGTVDFSTPPTALEEIKPYYHKAQSVLLPEFSHVDDVYTLQPAAYERLITSYYDTGVADTSLYVYEPLSFQPKMSLTMLAKILLAAMILLPALIIWAVVVAVHRIRKRRAINH